MLKGRAAWLTGARIPYPGRAIQTGRYDPLTIAAKTRCPHTVGVPQRRGDRFTGCRIPYSSRVILARCHDTTAVGAELSGSNGKKVETSSDELRALLQGCCQTKPMQVASLSIVIVFVQCYRKWKQRVEQIALLNQPVPFGDIALDQALMILSGKVLGAGALVLCPFFRHECMVTLLFGLLFRRDCPVALPFRFHESRECEDQPEN